MLSFKQFFAESIALAKVFYDPSIGTVKTVTRDTYLETDQTLIEPDEPQARFVIDKNNNVVFGSGHYWVHSDLEKGLPGRAIISGYTFYRHNMEFQYDAFDAIKGSQAGRSSNMNFPFLMRLKSAGFTLRPEFGAY